MQREQAVVLYGIKVPEVVGELDEPQTVVQIDEAAGPAQAPAQQRGLAAAAVRAAVVVAPSGAGAVAVHRPSLLGIGMLSIRDRSRGRRPSGAPRMVPRSSCFTGAGSTSTAGATNEGHASR